MANEEEDFMGSKKPVNRLTIKGFKSIRNLESLQLRNLNVLIGANGAGKSNFISYFRMLGEMVESRLQTWTTNQGSADRIVSFGVKETHQIGSLIDFGAIGYWFELEPTVEGRFSFADERIIDWQGSHGAFWKRLGSGHEESRLRHDHQDDGSREMANACYRSIASWKVYHFHDTSDTAGVKRIGSLHDNEWLRSDASNLAAFLFRLKDENPDVYAQIRKTVRLAVPFFDDFDLKPRPLRTGEEQIRLLWRQRDSDYSLWPSQLSDGTIRFICLVTALLQPDPPSTIIIDEPELGLHPIRLPTSLRTTINQ